MTAPDLVAELAAAVTKLVPTAEVVRDELGDIRIRMTIEQSAGLAAALGLTGASPLGAELRETYNIRPAMWSTVGGRSTTRFSVDDQARRFLEVLAGA
ncbi:hypothetical protein [Kitasatospora aureofaciens]|uniref:hypothetical protein n=1 Tax=Kitasatospora aureofaciens TaxID=1894 RepID=UPI0033F0CA0E